MKTRTQRTPEERQALISQVLELRKNPDISLPEACKEVGVNYHTFMKWQEGKGKKLGKRKYAKKRKKSQPVLVTSLVKIPETNENKFGGNFDSNEQPDPYQVAEMLAVMNARSLGALFSSRRNNR